MKHGSKVGGDVVEETRRVKGVGEDMVVVDSKVDNSGDGSKNSKPSEVTVQKKHDYIHVRARRGQATDSHSLAERVRREKISERMRFLQDLVPGCNKVTGKAGMLDEIINYVQSLQRQVEFLSMKLAALNPRLDFCNDNFFSREINPACSGSDPEIRFSSELVDPSNLQLNPLQEASSCCGLDMAMTLCTTMNAPVSVPDTFLDPFCIAHGSSSAWDTDLQSFPFQSSQGTILSNNIKMEM